MEELIKILEGIKPGVDFKNATGLIENGIIDSFDVVTIVSEINDQFGIEFPVSEVIPENFDSVESLYSVIEKCR